MRRNGSQLAWVLLLAGSTAWLAGCSKSSEQESMTTVDSTLSGSLTSDVPEPGPTPTEQYTPPPVSSPSGTPAKKPKPPSSGSTSSKPKPSSPSTVTVPAGTSFGVSLVTDLNTKTATTGSPFTATVAEDVVVNGQVVIPAGAEVTGHVVTAARSGKSSGRAYMQLAYDEVSFGGRSYNIAAESDTMQGKGGSGKDAAMIGGGAVAGGILGKVLGGSAAKGAIAGAAAGTAASLLTRGPDLHLEPGKKLDVTLQSPVTVPKPKAGA